MLGGVAAVVVAGNGLARLVGSVARALLEVAPDGETDVSRLPVMPCDLGRTATQRSKKLDSPS